MLRNAAWQPKIKDCPNLSRLCGPTIGVMRSRNTGLPHTSKTETEGSASSPKSENEPEMVPYEEWREVLDGSTMCGHRNIVHVHHSMS